MSALSDKLKEVVFSVLPITIIVFILHLTVTPLAAPVLIRFVLGAIVVVFGLALFLIGVDIGITPLGTLTGSSVAKTNKLLIVILSGLILGFFISIAEPGLMVLASQIDLVTAGEISSRSILVVVSIGMAVLVAVGLVRILYNIQLYKMLTVFYGLTFAMAIFASPEFLAIAFDASGATTGALAVPFVLALAVGVSSLKKNSKSSEEDSFGLLALASVGAIMSVLVLDLFSPAKEFTASLPFTLGESQALLAPFLNLIPPTAKESFFSFLPLTVILVVMQKVAFKLSKRSYAKIGKGFVYAFLGLLIFLVGVNAGFMDVGTAIGYRLAQMENSSYLVAVGFALGVVTILAEPAVYVLTHQIEAVTSGYVKRRSVLIALSLGVGVAVALSMVRILVPKVQLWHYLLPGYVISLTMSYFVPKLFVGIAFDAGGVATGPMTATFILAFTQGAAEAIPGASVLVDGFGMIAMVALMPIITLQTLGFIFALKSRKGGLPGNAQHEV